MGRRLKICSCRAPAALAQRTSLSPCIEPCGRLVALRFNVSAPFAAKEASRPKASGSPYRRHRPRKRIVTGRPRPQAPTGANQVWSYDFVFDWCANGQQLKCLTITDEWTKEGLAIEVDGGIRSGRVIEVLSRLISERGAPLYLRSDNGPEFVARALLEWIVEQGIEIVLIDPCKPWQNGATESFNGKFRDECLSLEWFRSRAEAKVVIEAWRRHCNEMRPHSSLGYLTPAEFVATLKENDAAPASATGFGHRAPRFRAHSLDTSRRHGLPVGCAGHHPVASR
jgi:putative transposase